MNTHNTPLDPQLSLSILTRTRALIAQGWCQEYPALDAAGTPVSPQDAAACRWCLEGALQRATWEEDGLVMLLWFDHPIYRAIQSQLPPLCENGVLCRYNDLPTTTQQDVIAVLERVIGEVGK